MHLKISVEYALLLVDILTRETYPGAWIKRYMLKKARVCTAIGFFNLRNRTVMLINIDIGWYAFLRISSLSDWRIFTQQQQHVCRKGRAILLTQRPSLGATLLTSLVVASAIMRLIMQYSIPGIHDGRRRLSQSVRFHRQPSEKRSILLSAGRSRNFRLRSLFHRCLYYLELYCNSTWQNKYRSVIN